MTARTACDAARRMLGALGATVMLAATGIGPVHGGGPLDLVNQKPVVYPSGGASLTLNIDQGPFGTRTNAQAVALVENAIALWNGVDTSTARLSLGARLATDHTSANYTGVFQKFSDDLNPVILDSDGAITDALFGVGSKSYILGFAGSQYMTTGPMAGKYREGQAVLNGYPNVSDARWTVVFAHEIGHFIGLDHSQLDGVQGLATSNFVLMYPIAYRSLPSLHEDDAAAVTSLYPAANLASTYGELAGTFTTVTGTPIRGANIWAKETATGKVYSVVSDFLTQGTGYFRLYLPAGVYNLFAESIDPRFTGGSSVGPYANTSTDVSFQPPHPIAPVALGGASPVSIAITPGCARTDTFRLDGSGSAGGNCLAPTLDVDASGAPRKYNAPTDGLLILRYLFGVSGDALTTGALGATAMRTDPVAIKAYLDGISPMLDIDGDGTRGALTDGLLIHRYLLGLRGDALIAGAVAAQATRASAAAIEAYLQTLLP